MAADVKPRWEFLSSPFMLPVPELATQVTTPDDHGHTTPPADYEAVMKRSLELATTGPLTGPNPQLTCILLYSLHAVVAKGWHEGAGS